ncbi:MAG TPA: hypothetical protein PK536_13505 [Ignavibacteria bacterium]|nr:hypothetical protein [Bacteroidota bacterium]HRI86454.1 hypothetical protein [Ignavibacteria bacterium]HRK00363.1 hypothetical protein [Ignavibacteria bacterium]
METLVVKDFLGYEILLSDFWKQAHPQIIDVLENATGKVITNKCNFYFKFESPDSIVYTSVQTSENLGKNDSVTGFSYKQSDQVGMYKNAKSTGDRLPNVKYIINPKFQDYVK